MSLTSIICAAALLTAGQVGPKNMPESIEPVAAPFPMPELSRPQFRADTTWVEMNSGGLSTASIQTAIDSMSRRGGGTVVIPAGVWTTGRITLKSNVELHLSDMGGRAGQAIPGPRGDKAHAVVPQHIHPRRGDNRLPTDSTRW